jgi:hypothetical protein
MFSDVVQVRWHSIYSIAKIGWEEAKMGALVFVCPTSGREVATGLEIDAGSYRARGSVLQVNSAYGG